MKKMKKTKKNNIVNNTIMLMIFNIAKIVFPFITLPYLTRVLTTDTYGVVTYVKTVMTYMQIFVDFGFVLSATKDIVKIKNNKEAVNRVTGDTLAARVILGLVGFLVIIVLSIAIPILRENILYTILSYSVVFGTIFLMDFLFRGIEKMHIITIRFIVMKVISTVLTFIFVKDDSNLLLIPLFDIASSIIAIILVFLEMKKLEIKMKFSGFKNAIKSIKDSFIYFLSNAASTSFNALSTIIIGIYLSKADVAFWGICIQVIGTIQACYSPISDGIYPEMIRSKDLSIVKKILKIFIPVIILGCIIGYFLTETGLRILGGEEYVQAAPVFKILIPVLLTGFLSIIFGWPTLGAIDKAKQVTISTVIGVIANIAMLGLLIVINQFNLISIAIVRNITELVLFGTRFYFFNKNKKMFNKQTNNK